MIDEVAEYEVKFRLGQDFCKSTHDGSDSSTQPPRDYEQVLNRRRCAQSPNDLETCVNQMLSSS